MNVLYEMYRLLKKWGDRRGSNPRQQESQSWALPTELRPPQSVSNNDSKVNSKKAPGQPEAYLKQKKATLL